jgi:hypothetical protein
MRWLALLTLTGCVPISADEFSGGRHDGGWTGGEIREDARTMDAMFVADTSSDAASAPDAVVAPARHDAGSSVPDDAATPPDASAALDAGTADAAKDTGVVPEVIDCNTLGVLCEDFERGPNCPLHNPGPNWSECEQIANDDGPQQEPLSKGDDAGTSAGHALRSRIESATGERSQRVLRIVPVEADYFEASFWMITDPTDNAWFVWTKFQQEVGHDDGDPLNYPGVSLVGQGGRIVLTVETQQSLNPADDASYEERDLGPWPARWHYYTLKIDFAKRNARVEYHDESYGAPVVAEVREFASTKVPVRRQYFAIGLYADQPGGVQMLFDDVFAYAKKDGKLIPLP